MKIAAFNGSPKGPRGNTHVMVREFLAGAQEAGAEVEEVFLSEKKIHDCVGCFTCWRRSSPQCAISDDMAPLLETFVEADLVILASPVYFGGVTGLMKNFIDRTLPLVEPHLRMDAQGVTRHMLRHEKNPDVFVIANCAFPDPSCFKHFRSLFDFLAEYGGFRFLGEILCCEGVLLSFASPLLEQTLASYRARLRRAGGEIVTEQGLSGETKTALAQPLLPSERYLELINNYWDQARSVGA